MCFLYNFCNCSLVSNVSYLTFKWLLYAPPGLTLKRAAFCTTSVFMCFLYNFCNCSLVSNVSYLTFKWLLYAPPGLTLKNSTFCPHTVFMCFVWISEQTAIISLYRINWLVFITETECLLRGTDCVFKYTSDSSHSLKGKCVDTSHTHSRYKTSRSQLRPAQRKMKTSRASFELLFCFLQKYFVNKISYHLRDTNSTADCFAPSSQLRMSPMLL